ncbi:hypothetical protein LXL04_030200 [Taraxacum kok-saghyz]
MTTRTVKWFNGVIMNPCLRLQPCERSEFESTPKRKLTPTFMHPVSLANSCLRGFTHYMGLELWSPVGRKSPTSAPVRSRTPDLHPHETYKPDASSQLSWGTATMEAKLYNIRLSTVVPGRVTVANTIRRFTNADLAMKHHYIKGVYFFKKEAAEGLIVFELKTAMGNLLSLYCTVAGRIRRRLEDNRPFIKCNDSGIRVVEAESNTTVDEWVEMKCDVRELAYSGHVLGPDLEFSPLVSIQFTRFKCGGISVGLSWSHILGDALFASTFMNMWSKVIKGESLSKIPLTVNTHNTKLPVQEKPYSFRGVDLVENIWCNTKNNEMTTFSIHISPKNVTQIISSTNAKPFEALSAIIWKSLAKLRAEIEPKIVTLCAYGFQNNENKAQGNGHLVSKVSVDFMVSAAKVADLAELITNKTLNNSVLIEDFVDRETKNSDVTFYGETLTFINLQGVNIYGFELKGHKPILVNYMMAGVGDEGVVLILQGPKICNGVLITMTLPTDEVVGLKDEIKKEWLSYD